MNAGVLLRELWQSWRASLRKPSFLLLASGVLALGIGASVAVFTLIDQVLMQPLPIPAASRVMVVGPLENGQVNAVSPLQYQHMVQLAGVKSIGLVFAGPSVNIADGGHAEVVSAAYMNRELLPTLGLQPALGRNFTTQEDHPNGPHVVLLGYGFWHRQYDSDPKVLGQTLLVGGSTYTVVGVLPKSFNALNFSSDVVLPLELSPNSTAADTNYIAVARLANGASQQAVAAEVNARMHTMYATMAGSSATNYWLHATFVLQTITAWQTADARAALSLFMACALFVLLTALVNLVNLMLLRAQSRAHDSAVRGALGAPPLRLALPALAEGLLISAIGALVGTGLAWLALNFLQGVMSADLLPGGGLHMPAWIWLLALVVSIAVGVLAAALSFWRSIASAANDELREGGRSGLGRRGGRLVRVLVVSQMLLATVLLCGTGLLLHGLYRAERTPLGFSDSHILTFDLTPVRADYPDAQSINLLLQQLKRRFREIPGVTAAVTTTNLPTGGQFNLPVRKYRGKLFSTQFRGVGGGFFKLFDIPLLRGRGFTPDDVRGSEPVAVVNRKFAEYNYGGHALGQMLEYGIPGHMRSVRIVGIVGNTRQFGPLRPAPEILYLPLSQMPDQILSAFLGFSPVRFALRGHGDPNHWRRAVRAAMTEVAPNQPISNFRTMQDVVRSTTASTRTTLLLVGVFAALALLLAVAGIYAVTAVSVTAREREFGVRMALGANPTRLFWLVLLGELRQIMFGLVIGVTIVLGVSGLLVQQLTALVDRTNTFDPVALISACVMLVIAGLAPCLLPAWRAARVQPIHALRGE
ncbi:MAG: ABC transporter permease [Betaproteobacteria bacterium]|jgi:predicted permease|nr:ABC transporter permease [Betaproteobacteria bacterium]